MKVLLVVYDNESYIHVFPIGLGYIAAVLRDSGHEVVIYSQDVHHYPDSHLTEYLNNNKFDAVGVSIIGGYYQYGKILKLSEAINASSQRPFYIIGGHGPAPEPEYFLGKTQADAIVIGEGEDTMVELMEAIAGKVDLKDVEGIAFRENDVVTVNNRRALIQDIDTIPFPAYDLFPMEYYRLCRLANAQNTDFGISMISGRGCTFKCNFCYRMDKGFRARSTESIVEEVQLLKRDYGITYIDFSDDLLMSSVKRTVELCEGFLQADLNVGWTCNGRLNYAKKDVLELMKRAGCQFINYGIEAMDDLVLKNMNKALTTSQIIRGIEATLDVGISPGFNIIFGNIGDNMETLRRGVEFLLKYDDCSQLRTIRPVTPYPGSELYYYAMEQGLLKDCADFYEERHSNSDLMAVNFTELSDEEFYEGLLWANSQLLKNYFAKKMDQAVDQARDLYMNRDVSFRGFRQS